MVLDFTEAVGRYDEEDGGERYGQMDLKFGAAYAQGLMEEGYKKEPFYKFDLRKFKQWCERALGGTNAGNSSKESSRSYHGDNPTLGEDD